MKEVTVYTTPTCSFCHMTKAFLNSKGVKYTEIDLTQDQESMKHVVEATGQMGVPVTKINDEYVIGFDQHTLNRLLEA